MSMVPRGMAFGCWGVALSRVEPLARGGVSRTIPIPRSRGKGTPWRNERLVPPDPALPAELRAPLLRPPRRGDARWRARALFPAAADHQLRAGGVRVLTALGGDGAFAPHRRGPHL